MKTLRKIIKEEIEKMLSESSLFYDQSPSATFIKTPSEKYNLGYAFASDTLQVGINNLNRYTLNKYLPKSINEESWSFTYETAVGIILIVDIKRIIRGGKSFWSMIFATLGRGFSSQPEIENEVENIEGYDDFVEVVNTTIAKIIDPSKY